MLSSATPWSYGQEDRLRQIPRDLFPKTNKKINKEWCENTYKYFHLFDSSVPGETYRNDDDLLKWETKAVELMDEIKERGFSEAKDEIVRLAKDRYKLKTLDNKDIVNFEDVVALFRSPEWYYNKVDHKRYMLYMFQYGIFRTSCNTWMHEAAYDWMYSYKITFEPEGTLKKQNKKGFVFELLHIKASNTIQDRFLKTCQRYLGEHLLCRNRLPEKKNDTTQYKELTFLNYTAYLVINKNHKNNIGYRMNDPKVRMQDSLSFAKANGMSKHEIMMLCESLFHDNGKSSVCH